MISSNRSAEISSAFPLMGVLKAVVRIVSTRLLFWKIQCYEYGRRSQGRVYGLLLIAYNMPSSNVAAMAIGASHHCEYRRALSRHRRSAEELVYCSVTGLTGGGTVMAGRPLHHSRAWGSAVGPARRCLPGRASDWRRAGRDWSRADCNVQVGRLATPHLCPDPLFRHRNRGRLSAAALHHEAHCQSAGLGVDSCTDCAGDGDSVLGCAAGPAIAGRTVRVQSPAGPGGSELV